MYKVELGVEVFGDVNPDDFTGDNDLWCMVSGEDFSEEDVFVYICVYAYGGELYRSKFVSLEYVRDFVEDLKTFGGVTEVDDRHYCFFRQNRNRGVRSKCLMCNCEITDSESFFTLETSSFTSTSSCGIHKGCLDNFSEKIKRVVSEESSLEGLL